MRLYSSSGGFTVYRGNYQYRVNIIIVIINYIFNYNTPIFCWCTYTPKSINKLFALYSILMGCTSDQLTIL